uniref:Uncharacterized protein n=1 Tax=Pipistrellus kuhlii TaxID=59472 RepID=A0A7J7WDW4_PIPKU|nr:hypothetical protein mPipKuh1_008043 [Pipistrellus kuhlii]
MEKLRDIGKRTEPSPGHGSGGGGPSHRQLPERQGPAPAQLPATGKRHWGPGSRPAISLSQHTSRQDQPSMAPSLPWRVQPGVESQPLTLGGPALTLGQPSLRVITQPRQKSPPPRRNWEPALQGLSGDATSRLTQEQPSRPREERQPLLLLLLRLAHIG